MTVALRSLAEDLSEALPDELTSVMGLARRSLGMDVAYVVELGGSAVAVEGDADSFGSDRIGLTDVATFGQRLASGEIPPVLADAATHELVRDLAITRRAGLGAYISVPLGFSNGELYGTFCCLRHEPDPHLSSRDLAYMELLGTVLARRLQTAQARRDRQQQIEDALASGAVDVALQPIVRLYDDTVTGVEALARFPKLGLRPDVVIEQAHGVGLGPEVELLAIRAALPLLSAVPAGAHLSVNIGPTALLSPGFTPTIRSCPQLQRVCLEITEHALIDDYAALNRTVAPLRRDGMLLAVDDVGAGYASLRHVLQMTPDIFKIDRSLIRGIDTDSGRRSIVTSVVLLALDLNATVVAEGVERTAERETLADLGVDMMQGYLFARPSTDPADWAAWQRADRVRTSRAAHQRRRESRSVIRLEP